MKCTLVIAVVALALAVGSFSMVHGQERRQVSNFEYKSVILPYHDAAASTKALNELGKSGWDLVAVTDTSRGDISMAYLKRPLAD